MIGHGHGFSGRNPIPFPSSSSPCSGRLLGSIAMGIEGRGIASALWSVGSTRTFSSTDSTKSNCDGEDGNGGDRVSGEGEEISFAEAKRLMRLVNVEALKSKLCTEGKEVISYCELLEVCESIGVARSPDEAASFARVLDEAGVVLLFRDKVYLQPDKV